MRRISTKIALPLILGLASLVAVACGEENPDPDGGEGGSGGGSTDIGDGEGGEPNTGGGHNGTGGGHNGTGGGHNGTGNSNGSGAEGGEGGDTGTGGEPPIIIDEPPLPECDEPDGEIESGPLDGDACWNTGVTCKGNATEQFLQQCSGTCIEPFNNFTRIDGFTGTL